MALQDLTPQLRTRLSRVERAVGFFVTIATLLLIAGFAYYIYHMAEKKGWFKTKVTYATGLNNAAGLKAGDPVTLMGRPVGELTKVELNDPGAYYGLTVYFEVQEPYYGYIWLDSKARVAAADFLGNRSLEIVKGYSGPATVLETNGAAMIMDQPKVTATLHSSSNELFQAALASAKKENPAFNEHALQMEAALQTLKAVTNQLKATINKAPLQFYVKQSATNIYWIEPLESPALTERLETVVNGFEVALPNILDLTNKITSLLGTVTAASSNLNSLLADAQPTVTNLAVITSQIKDPKGSLGEWLFPTNLSQQLQTTLREAETTLKTADATLKTADTTLNHADTNLTLLVSNLNLSLENLANLTSNLNAQVQSNSNIVSEVSSAIVHADEMLQGLKKHWLLRSAFKTNKTEKIEKEKDTKRAPAVSSPRATP